MPVPLFDHDTAVAPRAGGGFDARVDPRWDVVVAPNGGYLVAIAMRALDRVLPHPDPLTVTGHFLRPGAHGEADLTTEVVRTGRTVSTGRVTLAQAGTPRLHVVGTYGDLSRPGDRSGEQGLAWPAPTARPELPAPQDCAPAPDGLPEGGRNAVADRFDVRMEPGLPGWAHGRPTGTPELRAWVRDVDGRDPDAALLAVVVDALPPSVFELGVAGWTPTIELTLHLLRRPAAGWVLLRLRTVVVAGAQVEEEAEVWDNDGHLVATARQLARLPRSLARVASASDDHPAVAR